MEAARATWTDSRLDELNNRVKSVDTKMDAGFKRLDDRIDGTNERIDKLQHTLVLALVALISIIAVLLIAFLGLAATHL